MVLAQAPDHHVCAAYFKVVAVLAMRHTANRLMLRPSVCIMAVSSYMTRFPNERDLQAWGCLAIYVLVCRGFDNRPQPGFVGLPAISATDGPISALTHFRADAEVCYCACRALYALAVRLNLYYEPPVCQTVVLAVREHISAPLVCLWACRLMAALLNVNRTNQHNMTSMGALRYVVRVLRQYCDSDRDVCDAACRAVVGFARDNTANLTAMRASGACEYVIKMLRMALAKKDRQLCISSCDAIRALAAEGPEAKFTLQAFGGCEVVVAAARAFPAETFVWLMACRTIFLLADGHVDCQAALGAEGACEAVVMRLWAGPPSNRVICLAICRAIRALARGRADHQQILGELGACQAMVNALIVFPNNPVICQEACSALAALASCHPGNAQALQAAGADEVLGSMLRGANPTSPLFVAVLGALMSLASGNALAASRP